MLIRQSLPVEGDLLRLDLPVLHVHLVPAQHNGDVFTNPAHKQFMEGEHTGTARSYSTQVRRQVNALDMDEIRLRLLQHCPTQGLGLRKAELGPRNGAVIQTYNPPLEHILTHMVLDLDDVSRPHISSAHTICAAGCFDCYCC